MERVGERLNLGADLDLGAVRGLLVGAGLLHALVFSRPVTHPGRSRVLPTVMVADTTPVADVELK